MCIRDRLYHEAKEKPEFSGMGTTLVAAVADENTLYVANVGDSRLYLVRDRIRQVTRDHSYVEELVSLGRLERGSKDYKDTKNIITRAVGTEMCIRDRWYFMKKQMTNFSVLR